MSLTPEDVENQVFKERFRGYDQDEVDQFLDRVSASVAEYRRETEGLRARVRDLERQTAEAGESGKLLQRTLLAAQRSADETIDEARSTAEQTIEDARQRAAALLEESREEAQEIVAQAQQRLGDDERQAQAVLEQVRRVVDDLGRFRAEYRERVEAVIAEQLALLDRAGELPELPDGLRSLEALARPGPTTGGSEDGGQVSWDVGTQG